MGNMVVLCYLAGINLVAFLAFGEDKRRAAKPLWRISAATLLSLAVIGVAAGALAGMHVFRHKTRKPKFRFGIPALLVLELMLTYRLLWTFCIG